MKYSEVILASQSPRRRELLNGAGLVFRTEAADVNEDVLPGESALDMVKRLASLKAGVIADSFPGALVIGADTTVVNSVGEILAKPNDAADAIRMLKSLSASTHEVLTAVSIINRSEGLCREFVVASEVQFREMSSEEIADYVASGEPVDRAGAYAIQGKGAAFVISVSGSYTSVVGLPLVETLMVLRELGVWSSKNLL